jgi:hypothetical protein
MGDPTNDPYANLLARYAARRDDYLLRLTTDEQTFLSDPEKYGTAIRRGFLKGKGPRPQCSLADQDAAGIAADDGHHLIVWTDSQCLKAGIPEPWDSEDQQAVIARLWRITDDKEFQKSIPIPEEPPAEHGTVTGFQGLLRLLRQLTVCRRGDFRGRIRAMLNGARDLNGLAPDYNPPPTFDGPLIERVVEAFHTDQDPIPGETPKLEELAFRLSNLRIEGQDSAIPIYDARRLLKWMYAVLPGDVVADLVNAAINKGRPGPYAPRNFSQWEPAPETREKPPAFGGREDPGTFGAREDPGTFGAREKPTGGFESPNPPPPKPRGGDMLFRVVWDALGVLSWFGRLGTDPFYDVRSASLAMMVWLRKNQVVDGKPGDKGAQSVIESGSRRTATAAGIPILSGRPTRARASTGGGR